MAGVKIHTPTLPELGAHPACDRQNPLRRFSRIGIILAGGGAKGAYQAGALTAIYEFLDVHKAHAKVQMIAGTSIGSWNAMFWLANLIKSPGEDRGLLEQWWSNVNVQDVISPVPYILFRQNYLLSNKPWQQTFDRFFIENKAAHERLLYHMQQPRDDQAIHFYFTRTNVAQGRLEFTTNVEDFTGVEDHFDLYPHVLSTELRRRRTLAKTVEDLRTAVFSSMDLPPLFSYMKIDDMDYEDGGVIDNLPIRFGTDIEKCDLLFVLPLNANFEAEPNLRSIIKRLVRVMNIRQGVLERNSFKKMYYHNRLVDIHQELYLLCSEIKKARQFEDHLGEIIARLQDINNGRKDTTSQEKELVEDVINQLQTKLSGNKTSDRANEIISYTKENDLSKVQVFSICPSAKLAVNTSEFWKTIEAGHAFRHMYRVTKTELENFDFEAEQSKIRMLLVDPYGESTWLEDFYF
jgi:NTE family protein